MRICIAEDDTALRASLSFVLRSQGHEILEASDGQDALEQIVNAAETDAPVDLLITDIRMPDLSGLQLLGLLEEMERSLPTVVISGHGDREMLIDLLRLGCDNFLSKPFEPDEVLGKVDEVMRKVELQRDYHARIGAELKSATSQLDHEADTKRRDLEQLRDEVASAACTYRELIDVCKEDLALSMELKNRTLRDLGGDFAGSCCRGAVCDILVADVAGHDLAASYQTILVKSFFDENCRTGLDGQALFQALNAELLENGRNERMTTAMFVRFDLEAGQGELVSAGHPKMIVQRDGLPTPSAMHGKGDVLGLHDKVRFETRTFSISPGDRFFLYTDGVTGAAHVDGPTGQRRVLSGDGLDDLVEVFGHQPLAKQVESIWNYVLTFCRGKHCDDMLFMGIEIPER